MPTPQTETPEGASDSAESAESGTIDDQSTVDDTDTVSRPRDLAILTAADLIAARRGDHPNLWEDFLAAHPHIDRQMHETEQESREAEQPRTLCIRLPFFP